MIQWEPELESTQDGAAVVQYCLREDVRLSRGRQTQIGGPSPLTIAGRGCGGRQRGSTELDLELGVHHPWTRSAEGLALGSRSESQMYLQLEHTADLPPWVQRVPLLGNPIVILLSFVSITSRSTRAVKASILLICSSGRHMETVPNAVLGSPKQINLHELFGR